MKAKRAVLVQPKKFEIQEVEVSPKPDQVLVKVAACGLCNSDLNNWKGIWGTFPQTLGHEWAGTVVETGAAVKELKTGDRITGYTDGMVGYSEYITASECNCFKLESHVNLKYALSEPLKCCITVLRGTAPEAGDYGVIQGCGPMGLWCIQALAGGLLSSLIAIDIDDSKLELAKKYGATHVINPKKADIKQQIESITEGHMADFVIEGTGVAALLAPAQSFLKKGRGKLVLMSAHSESCKEFDFRVAVERSLQIIVPHPAYTTSKADDFRRAVAYLNTGKIDVKELVSHEFKLDDIQTAFETMESKPAGYLKGIIVP